MLATIGTRFAPVLLLCLATRTSLVAQDVTLQLLGTVAGPADLVRVSGRYAYVAAGTSLRIIDITDPSAAKPRGTIQLPAPVSAIGVSGSTVYTTMGLRGLAIVDVQDADAPTVAGFYKTAGEALRIAVAGGRAVLADRMAGADVINITDRTKPASVGAHYTDGYTRDVAVVGTLAYIVDSTNDFTIVDLSSSGEPKVLSTQPSTLTSTLVAVSGSAGPAKMAYVAGAGSLQTFDVSMPTAARRLGIAKIHARTTALVVEGRYGYAATGADGLQVLDLSDPANAVVVGSYKTTGPARDVAIADDLIVVASGQAGLTILRRSR